MALFNYTAVDNKGLRRNGTVEARSRETAIGLLKEQGFFVVTLEEKKNSLFESFVNLRNVPFGEIVAFTRQLATMVGAGLSIAKALNVLSAQTTNTKFRKMLTDVLRDVEGGASLASAFSKYPEVFPATYQSLVRAGESSGKLDEILNRLADTMEAERELRSKFKAAMIYPSIVFIAMVGVFFMLMTFVIPKLAQMYESLNVELPLMTRVMINISDFFINNAIIMAILIFGGIIGLRFFLRSQTGRNTLTFIAFKLPIFGKINKKKELTEFTRTLGMLIASAVPIVEALNIVSSVVSSGEFSQGAHSAAQNIEKGGSLSGYLKSNPAFPPILGNMVATGEETGRLDEILERLANFFDSETKHAVEGLSAALEPVILVMLGGMVGFLIISIITPIYKITSAI